jgi:hypothetical protein
MAGVLLMDVRIDTHYAATIPTSGVFFPNGPGTEAETLTVAPSGVPAFDPSTGSGVTTVLAEWSGDSGSRVQVIERTNVDATTEVVVWISAADVDGVVNTTEFPAEGVQQFGFVTVTID